MAKKDRWKEDIYDLYVSVCAIEDLWYYLECATDKELEDWTLEEVVQEAKDLLNLYYTPGTSYYEDLNSEVEEIKKQTQREVAKLKRFIKIWSERLKEVQGSGN